MQPVSYEGIEWLQRFTSWAWFERYLIVFFLLSLHDFHCCFIYKCSLSDSTRF